MAKRSTRIWIGIGVVAGAAIGAAAVGLIFGLFGAVAALLIGVFVVYSMASSASEQAFFETYAEQRRMSIDPAGSLPEATPLLRKGDERSAKDILEGPIANAARAPKRPNISPRATAPIAAPATMPTPIQIWVLRLPIRRRR